MIIPDENRTWDRNTTEYGPVMHVIVGVPKAGLMYHGRTTESGQQAVPFFPSAPKCSRHRTEKKKCEH